MADWRVIDFVGQTLVAILRQRFDQRIPPAGSVLVHLATPAAFAGLATNNSPRVTLFLYRVEKNAELVNNRPVRLADGRTRRQPLPLELCYLLTAWGVRNDESADEDALAAREEQRLIGVALEALYDHAEVAAAHLIDSVPPGVWHPNDGLQVLLDSLSIDDMYRIWDASELSYRLSVTYRVRVLGLESAEDSDHPDVRDARFDVGIARNGATS